MESISRTWTERRNWIIAASIMVAIGFAAAFAVQGTLSSYKERKLETVFPDPASPTEKSKILIKTNDGQELAIFLGDSRVARWKPLPVLPGVTIATSGRGGDTIQQIGLRFEQDVKVHEPELVVIQAGVNDLVVASLFPERSTEIIENFKSKLCEIVLELETNGTKLILMTIVRPSKPSFLRRVVWSDAIFSHLDDANAFIRSLARFDHVTVFDADALLSSGNETLPAKLAKDTLHFEPEAYELLNSHLEKLLPSGKD
ncbi:lysophospholipase L1-like esterase [Labrenzia sp. EL_13]|nr:lysophospholipase L1-like esterase [Labrenzia sp. EL_13]